MACSRTGAEEVGLPTRQGVFQQPRVFSQHGRVVFGEDANTDHILGTQMLCNEGEGLLGVCPSSGENLVVDHRSAQLLDDRDHSVAVVGIKALLGARDMLSTLVTPGRVVLGAHMEIEIQMLVGG